MPSVMSSTRSARGRGRGRAGRPMAEINVTPFVDVALVLLIIFMITAHVMEYGVEINVPKTRSVATSTKELPVVQITKTGDLYLGKSTVNINNLVDQVHTRYPGQQAVYVRAASEATWDIVANVMSVLGAAKLNVQAVTQPDNSRGGRR